MSTRYPLPALDSLPEDIKTKTNTLMEASMKLGQAIYEAQQAEEAASSGDDGDNVVDADYEEVKDDKKSA